MFLSRFLVLALTLAPGVALTQQPSFSGRVVDETGGALAGVSVRVMSADDRRLASGRLPVRREVQRPGEHRHRAPRPRQSEGQPRAGSRAEHRVQAANGLLAVGVLLMLA